MDENNNNKINKGRRRFLVTATSLIGGVGVAGAAVPFVSSWWPSARAQAAGAPVQIDISKLAPGAQLTVEWRGKPVWIIHRTQTMLDILNNKTDVAELRDPNSQNSDQQPDYISSPYRALEKRYLVILGICTHLGCAPLYRPDKDSVESGWPGGFFCPCHGSKFDLSGRVYKGVPAPTNLVVPPYHYISESEIIVGEGPSAAELEKLKKADAS